MRQLYLIDGLSLFYRFYHAPFQNLTASNGRPTKATFQFVRYLIELVRERQPHYLAVVFDGDRRALTRRMIYPAYKDREPPATEAITQIRDCRRFCRLLGLCRIKCEGYEADDALAALACRHVSDKVRPIVVSCDKDLMGLIADPRILMFDHRKGKWIDRKHVFNRYGVDPQQMPEFLMLQGDSCDNIPGVAGFGEKLAARYLIAYKDITSLIKAAKRGKLPSRLAANLLKAFVSGDLEVAKNLVRLDLGVCRNVRLIDLRCRGLNLEAARPLMRELGFWSLL